GSTMSGGMGGGRPGGMGGMEGGTPPEGADGEAPALPDGETMPDRGERPDMPEGENGERPASPGGMQMENALGISAGSVVTIQDADGSTLYETTAAGSMSGVIFASDAVAEG